MLMRRVAVGAAGLAGAAAVAAAWKGSDRDVAGGARVADAAAGKPTLTYFDGHGRAFVTRVAFRKAHVEYVDERIDYKGLDGKRGAKGFNSSVPLGQLPTLTLPETGLTHVQSEAIGRYAAKKAGLYPKDDVEALIVDDVYESFEEMFSKMPTDKDEAARKAKRAEYIHDVVPKYMAHLDRYVQRSGGPFVLGKTMTMADLVVFRVMNAVKTGGMDNVAPDALDKFASAKRIWDEVQKNSVVVAELDHQKARVEAQKKSA